MALRTPPTQRALLARPAAPAARRAARPPRAAAADDDGVPALNPVLGAVNRATMYVASNDRLNALKSGFWGLFAGSYDADDINAQLDAAIKASPVVVFAWSFSPFSKQACALLDGMGSRYTVINLDKTKGGMAMKKELAARTGRSSVPSVFIRGQHVGGCYDGPGLVPLYRSGELAKMLKRARAL